MDKFFEQLTSYNLLNNLLPGTIFYYFLKYLLKINFNNKNLIINLLLYYFCGIVISRVGSIIVEPILKKINFIKFSSYNNYLEARKTDTKLDVLLENSNSYRTYVALFLTLFIIYIYKSLLIRLDFLNKITPFFIIILLFILFLFSYKKQIKYIKDRIDHNGINNN